MCKQKILDVFENIIIFIFDHECYKVRRAVRKKIAITGAQKSGEKARRIYQNKILNEMNTIKTERPDIDDRRCRMLAMRRLQLVKQGGVR